MLLLHFWFRETGRMKSRLKSTMCDVCEIDFDCSDAYKAHLRLVHKNKFSIHLDSSAELCFQRFDDFHCHLISTVSKSHIKIKGRQ